MVPAKTPLGPGAVAFLLLCAAALSTAVGLEVLSLQQTHQPEKALWADRANWDSKTLQIAAFRISFQADSPPVLAAMPSPEMLLPVNDVLYTVETDVAGTRARLVVDTGSSDIWAKESVLASSVESGRAKVRSFQLQGEPRVPYLLLKFGVGSVFGVPITVKDFCVAGICVKDQDLVMGLQIKDVLELNTFDGLLGLAFPRDSQDPFGTPFLRRLQMMQNKTLSFALLLDTKKPFIAIGECKELLEGHQVHHMLPVHPVEIGLTMWTVAMDLNINDSQSGKPLLAATGFGALDSGSTLLVLPAALYLQLATHLFRAPAHCFMGNTILCMCDTELNDFSFTFGEFTVNFTKEELLLPIAEEVCRINIMPMPPAVKNLPMLILGQTFLRKVYAVFDPWKPAVWLADRRSAKVQEMQKAAAGSDFIAPPALSEGLLSAAAELAAKQASSGAEEAMRKAEATMAKGPSRSFDTVAAIAAGAAALSALAAVAVAALARKAQVEEGDYMAL